MIIKPKYPKKVLSNPYYSGIITGFLIASGFNISFFTQNSYTVIYGLGLFIIGIIYYYKKHKEFNGE